MIKLVNVSKYYNSNDVIALGLRKINLELHVNEFVAVVGESGSGKTTLLNVISGIDSYEDGEMYINGEETSYFSVSEKENYRKKYIAFVFQEYNLIDSYTVLQNVEAPLLLSGYPKYKIKKRAMEIIKRVGLEKHAKHKATKLSGGQKQRVVIARALAKDCPIIAADEPTGNLDSASAKQIIQLLADISKEKLVIMVTHEFSQVEEYATRKIRIYDGEIVEDREIKKAEKKDLPKLEDKEYKMNLWTMIKISLNNLLSVPKKTILMLMIFTFFALFVGLAYGGYVSISQNQTVLENTYFNYINPDRIVVKKADNQAFTLDELQNLKDKNNVKDLINFDYVMDQSRDLIIDDNIYDLIKVIYLPLSFLGDDIRYIEGQYPDGNNEVILAISDQYKDSTNDLHETSLTEYIRGEKTKLVFTISGIIDNDIIPGSLAEQSNFVFVSDDVWEVLRKDIYSMGYGTINLSFSESINNIIQHSSFEIDNSLNKNDLRLGNGKYRVTCFGGACEYDGTLSVEDYYVQNELDINVIVDEDVDDYTIFINQETYDEIFYDEIYQVSIMANKVVDAEGLAQDIANDREGINLKYQVVYPYNASSMDEFMGLMRIMESVGMIIVNVITIFASTFLTYIIFKIIINTKLRDYAIFRTIGANQNVVKTFIYVENLFIVMISFFIFLAISLSIPVNPQGNFNLLETLTVYSFFDYVVYFILLVLMSLFISRRYCNKIFANSVSKTLKTDLE
ncbi:MAG: ATP-binding cassette domain-containing protein [Candidatus Izemoplasmatales bacterium]|nr:ATP-binding cassette domain-containing protein [Candidatus Izemoplasmatales bacterium]